MPNPYYNYNDDQLPGSSISSQAIDAQFQAIEAGFDKLGPIDFTFGGTDVGSVNQYNVVTDAGREEPFNLQIIIFAPLNTNTSTATLALNSGTAYPIVRNTGVPLSGQDVIAGVPTMLLYDATNSRWAVVGSTGAQTQASFRPGVRIISDETYTIVFGDETFVLLFTFATGATITIPADSTEDLPIGFIVHLHQSSADQITVNGESGVTIYEADSQVTRKQFSSLSLIKVAANTWHIIGDQEVP